MDGDLRIIVGIGNPGSEYVGTRHNIGWAVIDALEGAAADPCRWSRRCHGEVGKCRIQDLPVLLVKPTTFVNGSGASVLALLADERIALTQLLVIVDDIHLPVGDLRLRGDGSAGGHNGLRDIEARIGRNYPRLRVGVGAVPDGVEQIAHVLGRFTPEEQNIVSQCVVKARNAVTAWMVDGVGAACRFNGPIVPRTKVDPKPSSNIGLVKPSQTDTPS